MRKSFDEALNAKVNLFGRPTLKIVVVALIFTNFIFLGIVLPLLLNTTPLVPVIAFMAPIILPDFLKNSKILHKTAFTKAVLYIGILICTTIYIYLAFDADNHWKYIHYPAYGLFGYLWATKY